MHRFFLERTLVALRIFFILGLLAGPASSQAGPRVCKLQVVETTGSAREAEPVASGIPLPQGAVFQPSELRLYRADHRPVPLQAQRLGALWPDGSLRWVLVQFQASLAANSRAEYVLVNANGVPPPKADAPLLLFSDKEQLRIVSGGCRWSFSRSDFALPNRLEVFERGATRWVELLQPGRLQLQVDRESMTPGEFAATGRAPEDLASFGMADHGSSRWHKVLPQNLDAALRGPVRFQVEESGPLRAVVRVESDRPPVEGQVGFVLRIYAYAGKPWCKFEYTLQNYEQYTPVPGPQVPPLAICNSKHIRSFNYRLQLKGKTMSLNLENTLVSGDRPGSLAVDSNHSQHSPGWAVLSNGQHRVAVANRWFWEIAPKKLSYEPARGLQLEFWPADQAQGYPLAAGRSKTYEFGLGVDSSGSDLSRFVHDELRATPSAAYVAATGASYRTVDANGTAFPQFGRFLRASLEAAHRDQLYGDLDFGDQIGWSEQERWNGYHDGASDWFLAYLSSGALKYFQQGEAAVWHELDVDTQSWGYQPGCREGSTGRAFDHVCTRQVQGVIFSWHLGQLDYYLLTGRRRVYESLLRSCDFLLDSPGVRDRTYVPERQSALPMLNLAAMLRALGEDPAGLGGRSRQTDSLGRMRTKRVRATLASLASYFRKVLEGGELQRFCVFPAYVSEGLYQLHLATDNGDARIGIQKAAQLLYGPMAMKTGAIRYASGAPWPADSPDMPWWDGVQAPSAYVYQLTSHKPALDGGRSSADWLLNYRGQAYSSSPFRWQGAGGYSRSLAHYLWALEQAGYTQDYLRRSPSVDGLAAEKARCLQEPFEPTYQELAAEIGRQLVAEGNYAEARAWSSAWKGGGPYMAWVVRRLDLLQQEKNGRKH